MDKDTSKAKPGEEPGDEISEEVLQWISGGNPHGCPLCPHPWIGSDFKSGSHILVDGSIFEDGEFKRKL